MKCVRCDLADGGGYFFVWLCDACLWTHIAAAAEKAMLAAQAAGDEVEVARAAALMLKYGVM